MDLSNLCKGLAVGGVLAVVAYKFYRTWVSGKSCLSAAKLSGKTAIVTGANTGIGLETAVDLARRGAKVILACRSVERGERAAAEVRRRSGNHTAVFTHLDLSSLGSVRDFAKEVLRTESRIDILVNNAGVCCAAYRKTQDGFEEHLGINHLGHFLLTNLLLPRMTLSSGQPARVVNVTSSLYKRSPTFDFALLRSTAEPRGYSPWAAYSQSKLANILFTRELGRRLEAEGSGVCAYAVHPGVIFTTELGREHVRKYSYLKRVSYKSYRS